jgi:hypothetical protein
MLEMQVDVILVPAHAPALADLDRHRATDDVAGGQVLGVRRIPLHEALAFGIRQIPALTARALGNQAPGTVDPRRMELDELEILQRQPGSEHHGIAVTRAGVRRGAREIGAPITAGRQDDHARRETVQPSGRKIDRDDAAADPVDHDQIDREILDIELGVLLQRLLIERMQHRMPGAIGRGAGALRGRPLAEMRRHAAERPLIDAPGLGTRKRHTVVLELDDRSRRLAAKVLDGVLIAEPVRALDRVVHVPTPIVVAHIAERGADSALGRDRVASRREDLGDAGRREILLGQPERRP